MWENLYKKPYLNWKTAVKTLIKHQNVPTRTRKKRQILFHRFLGEYTFFLTPHPLFFEEWRDENSKILGRRGTNFFKIQDERGRERENTKFVELVGIFQINLLAIRCHGN